MNFSRRQITKAVAFLPFLGLAACSIKEAQGYVKQLKTVIDTLVPIAEKFAKGGALGQIQTIAPEVDKAIDDFLALSSDKDTSDADANSKVTVVLRWINALLSIAADVPLPGNTAIILTTIQTLLLLIAGIFGIDLSPATVSQPIPAFQPLGAAAPLFTLPPSPKLYQGAKLRYDSAPDKDVLAVELHNELATWIKSPDQ